MTSRGVLEVVLVDSEGIRDKKFLGCIICCTTSAVNRPYERGRNRYGTKNLSFPLKKKSHIRSSIVFRVMDKHKLSDDRYVGEATIYIKDICCFNGNGEAELGSRKYRVVREDKSYTGDVSVAVTFKFVPFTQKNGKHVQLNKHNILIMQRKDSVVNNVQN